MIDVGWPADTSGEPSVENDDARQRVRRKRTFYMVVGIYVVLSLGLFAIDLLDDPSGYWLSWLMLGAGLGVVVADVLMDGVGDLFGPNWERPARSVHRPRRQRRLDGAATDLVDATAGPDGLACRLRHLDVPPGWNRPARCRSTTIGDVDVSNGRRLL